MTLTELKAKITPLLQKGWILIPLILIIGAEFILFRANYLYAWVFMVGLAFGAIALLNVKYIWWLGIILMPFSQNFEEFGTAFALTVPSDLVAITLWGYFLLQFFIHWKKYIPLLRHPILIIFGLYLAWMLVCTFTSSMPVISLKYFLSMFWYGTAFLWGSVIFFENKVILRNWIFPVSLSLLIVVGYTIYFHGLEGFSLRSSYHVMQPFYKEHTAYATSITLLFAYFVIYLIYDRFSKIKTIYWLMVSLLTGIGILTIYTRGAWLGVLGAGAVFGMILIWERYRKTAIAFIGLITIAGIWFIQKSLTFDTDSDKKMGIQERLFSAFNTKHDLSNMERINRWVAAVNMIKESPVYGFGPGTYAMQYAPYQQSNFRTRVSTNLGNLGTTHNEFLLAGSEMGIPGMLMVMALYVISLFCGIRGYFQHSERSNRWLYLPATLGLITYYLHAVVNNYLDQDKVAIPVFLCLAQIIALDVYNQPKSHPHPATPENPSDIEPA
jgi:O-antigen ligase